MKLDFKLRLEFQVQRVLDMLEDDEDISPVTLARLLPALSKAVAAIPDDEPEEEEYSEDEDEMLQRYVRRRAKEMGAVFPDDDGGQPPGL